MPTTLAFDVYGTLIDTHGIVSELHKLMGDTATNFSHTWRQKQLEYSFRRGLMGKYETFAVCTRNALDYACAFYAIELTNTQKTHLLESYRKLPAFADVASALKKLAGNGHRLYAFSNGTAEAVDYLLVSAGIRDFFEGIVSADDIKTFKPSPAVYQHFLEASGSQGGSTWLVSSNPFDVIGALSAGLNTAWLKRSESALFDPWGVEPTATIATLGDLVDQIDG